MRIIITGSTGMVGEGVLLECLETDAVEKVLTVSRKSVNHTHPKLEQLLVPDFKNTSDVEAKLTGYDACFYCAGVSSVGMSEADYTAVTYDTTIAFATTLARLNPNMVFTYVTGSSTDSTEKGKSMWARVKGRTENALMRLPFKGVYNFRPGLMMPKPGQKHLKTGYRVALVFAPILRIFFKSLKLSQVGRAMIRCVQSGAPKQVLEIPDIAALAAES
ncbi:MAG TPA: NAD-dependent epimerase/dehydratase family protein [Kofleriaceae bacterium]|nr:NAD-dependent epimerase/dehydratase family protein [Kofleriaceae bacterium]